MQSLQPAKMRKSISETLTPFSFTESMEKLVENIKIDRYFHYMWRLESQKCALFNKISS